MQHVVIFKLVESFTDEQLEKAVKQTAVMVDTIPGIITASFAKNADNLYDTFRSHTKGYTHTLLATFENEQALKRYDTEPTHLELGKLIIITRCKVTSRNWGVGDWQLDFFFRCLLNC